MVCFFYSIIIVFLCAPLLANSSHQPAHHIHTQTGINIVQTLYELKKERPEISESQPGAQQNQTDTEVKPAGGCNGNKICLLASCLIVIGVILGLSLGTK